MTQIDGTSAEAQLVALYAEREQLVESLGVADAQSLIDMVRSLEAQLATMYRERETRAHDVQSAQASSTDAPATAHVADSEHGRTATDASLELQLQDLYRQREFLEERLGCSDAEQVCGMVASLEAQLRDLYHDRETGAAEAAAVVQRIRSIADELGHAYDETELVYENDTGPTRWAVTWRHR